MRYIPVLGAAAIMLASATTAASAATWNVVPGGGGDATTIQGGIDLATNGDVVVVASGTYTGPGNVNVTFNGKNITVTSTAGAYFTVIDCQGSAQGFLFQAGEGPGAVLEGFTIKNGFAVKGAAVYCDDASPIIRYCVFSSNTATTSGGAIHLKKGAPTVHNNTLDGNGAPAGGGMWVQGPGSPQIYQNIVCNSTAGGAFACAGFLTAFVACNDTYANAGGDAICAGDSGNNFTQDPLFCGIPGSGNFFLQETSPCSSTYSPCAAPVGAFGVQCQVTATEAATWGGIKSLYR
jgi:predicted outer membrane repeat protein